MSSSSNLYIVLNKRERSGENKFTTNLSCWILLLTKSTPRLYYFKHNNNFIILCIVVDDIAFSSNNRGMMTEYKQRFSAIFGVKFYSELRSFIRFTIGKTPRYIYATQKAYLDRLLSRFHKICNPVSTTPPENVYTSAWHVSETPLNLDAHQKFQEIIGGISYLSHCKRPELIYYVAALSRSLHELSSSHHLSFAKRTGCW